MHSSKPSDGKGLEGKNNPWYFGEIFLSGLFMKFQTNEKPGLKLKVEYVREPTSKFVFWLSNIGYAYAYSYRTSSHTFEWI